MTYAPFIRSPRALTAVAAVLALSSTPAFAQEVAPTAAAPVIEAPAPVVAAPTIVLPDVTTMTTTPESTPEVAEPAPRAQRTAPRRAATAPTPPAAAPVRATVPTARASGTAADGALAEGSTPLAPIAPEPVAAASQPVAAPAPVAPPAAPVDDGVPVTGILGLLAALGIAGVGIAGMRSRRRRNDEVDNEEVDYAPETALDPVVGEPAPASLAAPLVAPLHAAQSAPAHVEHVNMHGAAAILASSPLPETADERRELLDAMASAEPDEDNPFTSRKARMRRARIQLQHREHLESRGQPFDFRTYQPPVDAGISAEKPPELTPA